MRFVDQKGVALLAVIFFLVVIAFTGIVFISLSSNSMTQSVNEIRADQALFIAEGGMERARGFLAGKDATCPGTGCNCGSISSMFSTTPVALGQGQFTVTGTPFGGQCILTSTGGVPTLATGTVQRVITYTALTSIQDAWAVGYNVTGVTRPFMAHWDGTVWTNLTTSAPNISGANLMEVSAVNSSDVWAVSSAGHFIHYNGTAWSLTQTFSGSVLNSIYMNSSNDGWAVANLGKVAHWNGTAWSMSYTLNATNNTTPGTLLGVYCLNASYCWAVGNRVTNNNNVQVTSIFLWNGTTWSYVPTAGFTAANFRYVSCVDTTHCWAVGSSGGEIILWDSSSWKLKDNNNPSLWGVDCVDINNCWAVGYLSNGGNQVNFWNVGSWTLQSPPTNQRLTFVSCVTTTDCWASGWGGVLIHLTSTGWSSPVSLTGGSTTVQINSISQFRSGNSATSWKEVFQ